jgi:hypothetical protein
MTRSLLIFLIAVALMCASNARAQKSVYFIDHAEVPLASGYRAGYIVTLNGDTIAGRLRNTESLGKILAPEKLTIGSNFTVELTNYGEVSKIAFIPADKTDAATQKLLPADIRAFGYLSAFANRQVIDLDAAFDQNGSLQFSTTKKSLFAALQNEDASLLLRATINNYATFESKYIESEQAYAFLQVLSRGRLNLYLDTWRQRLYVSKAATRDLLYRYSDGDPRIYELFNDSKEIAGLISNSPEMRRGENFIKLAGIYNLEADNNLQARYIDYVITNQKDTVTGTVAIKGLLSSYVRGMVSKVTVAAATAPVKEFKGSEIKRMVRYINNTPLIFDAYEIKGTYLFYQLLVAGKVNLYYDARGSVTVSKKPDGQNHRKLWLLPDRKRSACADVHHAGKLSGDHLPVIQ